MSLQDARTTSAPPVAAAGPVAVPADRVASLYERRKALYPTVFWSAMVASVALHWLAFEMFPTVTTEVQSPAPAELMAVELPPRVEIPPPPEHIARPAIPVMGSTDLPEDVTIAPTTFEYNKPELVVPRPVEEALAEERKVADGPRFTPYTVAPLLKNRDEAARAIVDNYPPTLKAAGLGGDVTMWFFIDEEGKVQDYRVARASAFPELDSAAVAVAGILEFTPAKNRDRVVPVWVQIPIEFSVRTRE